MRTLTFGRKRWRLEFVPMRGHGLCESPGTRGKTIQIRRGLLARRHHRKLLEAMIHEGLHASDWTKDEEWVDETAEDLTRMLWGLGFRLPGDTPCGS